jgi:hypothetical protein
MAMSESGKALEPEHSVVGASPKPEEPIYGEENPQEHIYEEQIPIGRTLDVDVGISVPHRFRCLAD